MKKGDLLELDIIGYAFEGKGVAKIIKDAPLTESAEPKKPACPVGMFVVFVNGTYPGDKVIAIVTKIRKSYAEAKVKTLINRSSLRTDPNCKYFGVCGGCKAQDLIYESQAKFKEEQIKDIFERIGGLEGFEALPIEPSEKTYFYRNKMEFSFSEKRWLTENEINSMQEAAEKDFALGFHVPGVFDKVLNIDGCWLQSELSNRVLNFVHEFSKNHQLLPYSSQKHTGFLRNLVIKQSFSTKDFMVNLVVSEENERLFVKFKEELVDRFPEVTTIVFNINKKLSQVAYGDYEIVAHGPGFIYDMIGNCKFRISANSFFQTNSSQANTLYSVAKNFADFKGDEIVYDLYSGAGTIPIFISKKVRWIYGFESVEPAINDALVNIELNGISNFKPIIADLNKSFLPIITENNLPKPDIIITDPPRSGMNPKTVKDIIELEPKKIVYISCNPATQARDIKLLCSDGYRLKKIKPVDMFPHTYHIENVALLTK